MIRKDWHIAFNLLHLLDKEPIKVKDLHNQLNTKYYKQIPIGRNHLQKIVSELVYKGLCGSKTGYNGGIFKTMSRISFLEVAQALNFTYSVDLDDNSPAGKVYRKYINLLEFSRKDW